MSKTVNSSPKELKPKLLHLPKEVIHIFSIKAANEETSAKTLMQDILAKAAEEMKDDNITSRRIIEIE